MLQLPNRHAFSISTRYRAASCNFGTLTGGSVPTINSTWKSEAFNEIAISYALPVFAFKNHHLRVGATYKILGAVQYDELQGIGSYSATNNRFSGTVRNFSNTFNEPFSFSKIDDLKN